MRSVPILCAMALVGCASLPNLTVPYFVASAEVEVKVTQTAACTSGNIPVLASDVSFAPRYFADRSSGESRRVFDFSELGWGVFKADVALEFFDDGRLKSANATQTGQVGEVLDSVLSIADLLPLDGGAGDVSAACQRLRALVGDGKPLTIVHVGTSDFVGDGSIEMKQTTVQDGDLRALLPIFGEVTAAFTVGDAEIPPVVGDYSGPSLRLREPARAEVSAAITRGSKTALRTGEVWVGQKGQDYLLPIQKSPWFGENEMELKLSEAGRITKLRYSGGGIAAGAASAIDAVLKAQSGNSVADKAARAKAEADLIYQQQRLVACRLDATSCAK